MQTMRAKYESDNAYRAMVDVMKAQIYANRFTPSEMREMAVLACIQYEMENPHPPSFRINRDTEASLRTLQELREKELANATDSIDSGDGYWFCHDCNKSYVDKTQADKCCR